MVERATSTAAECKAGRVDPAACARLAERCRSRVCTKTGEPVGTQDGSLSADCRDPGQEQRTCGALQTQLPAEPRRLHRGLLEVVGRKIWSWLCRPDPGPRDGALH